MAYELFMNYFYLIIRHSQQLLKQLCTLHTAAEGIYPYFMSEPNIWQLQPIQKDIRITMYLDLKKNHIWQILNLAIRSYTNKYYMHVNLFYFRFSNLKLFCVHIFVYIKKKALSNCVHVYWFWKIHYLN